MSYTAKGTIKHITPAITRGKSSYIQITIQREKEYNGKKYTDYPSFQVEQKKFDILNGYREGDTVELSFDLKGIEYTDKNTAEVKYFTIVNCYNIKRA